MLFSLEMGCIIKISPKLCLGKCNQPYIKARTVVAVEGTKRPTPFLILHSVIYGYCRQVYVLNIWVYPATLRFGIHVYLEIAPNYLQTVPHRPILQNSASMITQLLRSAVTGRISSFLQGFPQALLGKNAKL